MTRIVDSGFHVELPDDWTGNMIHARMPEFTPPPVLQMGNFPMEPDLKDSRGQKYWETLGPGQMTVALFALPSHASYFEPKSPFEPLVPPLAIRPDDFRDSWEGVPAGRRIAHRVFTIKGRAFQLLVVFGSAQVEIAQYAELNSVLASFALE